MAEYEKIKELELQIRIGKLSLNSLKTALLSITDTDVLEAAVGAGEAYQELRAKLIRKEAKK